jgi:Uma2 family endonuclease
MGTVERNRRSPDGSVYGEPTWEVAELFPYQGDWRVSEYLALNTKRRIEFWSGFVEFLPSPTLNHQLVMMSLYCWLHAHVAEERLGCVLAGAFPVRLWDDCLREPDVFFLKREHAARMSQQYWEGADLVMEVVDPDDRKRDLVTKREEYAQARISEYWIVEPENGRITMLTLNGSAYEIHGEFRHGDRATSKLLPGFVVDVTSALTAEE